MVGWRVQTGRGHAGVLQGAENIFSFALGGTSVGVFICGNPSLHALSTCVPFIASGMMAGFYRLDWEWSRKSVFPAGTEGWGGVSGAGCF